MATLTLKEMKINVGKADRLAVLATELGIEPEEGQNEYELAEAMMAAINAKDDTEWEAMTSDLKEWSNMINAAKKLYKEAAAKGDKKAAKPKGKSKTKPTDEHSAAEKAVAAAEAEVVDKKKAPAAPKPPKAEKKAAAAPKAVSAKPTKAELAELKAAAKAKAAAGGSDKKKQVISDKPYKPGGTAHLVSMVIKDAGKKGISVVDGIKEFEKRLKKTKLESANPSGWCKKIFHECVKIKGLAEKKGDLYFPTKKLLAAE